MVNPHLQRGDRLNLATALAPVAQVSSYQYVLVVNPEVPARTLPELIAHVRSRPRGEVSYSSGGVGNANHLAGVLFENGFAIKRAALVPHTIVWSDPVSADTPTAGCST